MPFRAAWLAALSLLVGLVLAPSPVASGASRPPGGLFFIPHEELLTDEDLRSLDRGRPLARVVETRDRSEVMAMGVLRVRATAAQALERLRDLEARRGDGDVVAIRRIAMPPALDDFADLVLPTHDLNSLPNCRLGDCDVRMPEEWMRRFKREIDWSSPQHEPAASDLFREMVSGYTRAYLAVGNAGLPLYEDGPERTWAAESLDQLLRRFDGPLEAIPELRRYLLEFPQGRPEGAEDFLYWVRERMWAHQVVSVNHVTILERTLGPRRMILAASKLIYASHYFDSALKVTVFLEEPGADPWLIFLTRSRTDVRPGFSWLQRLLIRRLVSGRVEQRLVSLRHRLETEPRPLPAQP